MPHVLKLLAVFVINPRQSAGQSHLYQLCVSKFHVCLGCSMWVDLTGCPADVEGRRLERLLG